MTSKPGDPILEAIAVHPRLRQDQSVLVGVSGGRDSVVLLHGLVQAGFKHIIVCHLDHALRVESRADAVFVTELAHRYGLTSEVETEDVAELAREEKLSIETAARVARYEFFAEIARAHWCPRLILAHHADDQVETFLLNLLRGSGRAGLGGMRPISIREEHGGRLEIHRPLLGVWREQIDIYVEEHKLEFREDPSNIDRRHTRNRIRHDIIPALSDAVERDVRRALWRTAEILGAEDEWLSQRTPEVDGPELDVADLRALPLALQRRLISKWLRSLKITDLSFDDVDSVCDLVESTRRSKVNLAGDRHVRRRSGKLFVE